MVLENQHYLKQFKAASAFFIGLPYVKQRHITDDKNIILEATGYINDSGTFSWRRESLSR